MRFLMLTQYFPPEIGGPQTRLRTMATELKRLGHEVEIVTGLPNYPMGKFLPGYERSFYCREMRDGILVHRVWMYPAIGGGFRRMLNYVSFTMTCLFGLLQANKPDFIFVESPPILLSIPAYLMGMIWKTRFIFNVADLWPDVIVDGEYLKEGLWVRFTGVIERGSYRKAANFTAVTEGIRDALHQKKMVPREKILFLPNGADTQHYHKRPANEVLKHDLGLT